MKKTLKICSLILFITLLCGCLETNSKGNNIIYTSVYPVQFVTETLYGDKANIVSIYPADSNPYEYKLTKKQIKDYSNSNLVIYNGLSSERDYAVEMLNTNKNLKIIDATARIQNTYSLDEIWINPASLLVIAKNVRDGLNEYVNIEVEKNSINEKYDKLKIELSELDSEIKSMVETADKKTIIVSSNDFLILEKYGFEIISLDESTINDKAISDAKKLLNNKECEYIFIKKDEKISETVKAVKDSKDGVKTLELDTLKNISSEDKNNKKNYITIMEDNIKNLKMELE